MRPRGHEPGQQVGQQQGDRIVSLFQLLEKIESRLAGVGPEDPIFLGVAGFEVALDSPEHGRVIVDSVSMILNTLAQDSGRQVYPIGPAKAFFKALEIVALNAAGDLSSSMWATRYACAIEDLRNLAMRVSRVGNGFSYGGERIGQGREQAKAFLRERPEILQQIEGQLFEKFGVRRGPVPVPAPEPEPEEKKVRKAAK